MDFYKYHSFIACFCLTIGIVLRFVFAVEELPYRYLTLTISSIIILSLYAYNSFSRNKFIFWTRKFLILIFAIIFGFYSPKNVIQKGTTINREFIVEQKGKFSKITTNLDENIFIISDKTLYKSNIYRGNLNITNKNKIGNYFATIKDPEVVKKREFSFFEKQKFFYTQNRLKEFNKVTRQYFSSLIFGDNSDMTKNNKKKIKELGVSHLFAISGMHIGIIVAIISFIISKFSIRFQLKVLLTIFIISFYALLTSLSPSVLRSVFMFGIISIGTLARFRYQDSINSLFLAYFMIILIDPTNVFNAGFQLSFSATFGIIYFINGYKDFAKRLNPFFSLLIISIIAIIFTFPLIAYHFGEISPLSIVSTILLSPIVTIFVTFGAIYLSLFPIPILSDYIRFSLEKTALILNNCIYKIHDIIPLKTIEVPENIVPILFLAPIFFVIFTFIKNQQK